MNNMMTFPKTIDEFIDSYKFVDRKEVYTNGSELIQVFRVQQAIEHYLPKWISVKERLPELGMRVIVNIKGHGKVKPYQSVWTFEDGERELWEQWVTHWMPLPDPPEEEK